MACPGRGGRLGTPRIPDLACPCLSWSPLYPCHNFKVPKGKRDGGVDTNPQGSSRSGFGIGDFEWQDKGDPAEVDWQMPEMLPLERRGSQTNWEKNCP